jgi:hypothetical protein
MSTKCSRHLAVRLRVVLCVMHVQNVCKWFVVPKHNPFILRVCSTNNSCSRNVHTFRLLECVGAMYYACAKRLHTILPSQHEYVYFCACVCDEHLNSFQFAVSSQLESATFALVLCAVYAQNVCTRFCHPNTSVFCFVLVRDETVRIIHVHNMFSTFGC